jgi:hypothetical protein
MRKTTERSTTNNYRKALNKFFIVTTLVITTLTLNTNLLHAEDKDADVIFNTGTTFNTLRLDYKQFYSQYRFMRLCLAYGIAATSAGSDVDDDIQDFYQDHVRNSTTDKASNITKNIGNGWYIISLSAASAAAGAIFPEGKTSSDIGTFGERSLRAIAVGGPAVVLMQYVTGASRPKDMGDNSSWEPFKSHHGVSGHTFIGAIPFLTLAHMYDEEWYIKYPLYVASTLTGLSRINDDEHFFSQVGLGWYMAWEATQSIDERDSKDHRLSVVPLIAPGYYGLQLIMKW